MDSGRKKINIEKPDYDLEYLFDGKTKKQVDAEWCYAMWCQGESMEQLAADIGVSESALRKWIKDYVGRQKYEIGKGESKLNRAVKRHGEMLRITHLAKARVLEKLENREVDSIKELLDIEKVYGDRLAIAAGEATEQSNIVFEIVNYANEGLEKD